MKSSQTGTETQTCERPLYSSDQTVNKVTQYHLRATSTCENATKRLSGEIPISSENVSKDEKVLISQSHSEQIKNESSDTLQGIKEEKTEASIEQKPTEITTDGSFNSSGIKVMAEEERIGASCEILAHLGEKTHTETPGKDFVSVKLEEKTSHENMGEKHQEEQQFGMKREQSCEEPLDLPAIKNGKANTVRAKANGPSQETVNDTGVLLHVTVYIFCSCIRKCKPQHCYESKKLQFYN